MKPIIQKFDKDDKFEQATIGIYAYDKEVIPYLNNNISFSNGIYVAEIIKNGPASKSDLKEGDIINSIDGVELKTMNDLRGYIYKKRGNDKVILKIVRGKINKEIEIVLRKKINSQINLRVGAAGGIRIPDLSVRSRVLYPAKLLLHKYSNYYTFF